MLTSQPQPPFHYFPFSAQNDSTQFEFGRRGTLHTLPSEPATLSGDRALETISEVRIMALGIGSALFAPIVSISMSCWRRHTHGGGKGSDKNK